MEPEELRHEVRVLLKKVVDICRREGMGAGGIARKLSIGHSPTDMYKLCLYLRVLGERDVQYALFSLANAFRLPNVMRLCGRSGVRVRVGRIRKEGIP